MLRRPDVANVINVADMRELAQHLPRPVFDAIDGGAGDEVTLRDNSEAFQRIRIRPRSLVDVSKRNLSTTVLGTAVAHPIMVAPCSFGRMAHRDAEIGIARAAATNGAIYACPGGSSYSPEAVMAAADGPKWYQLYLPTDPDAAEQVIASAERAGYPVLCVTVDSPVLSFRERDIRNKLSVPLRVTPSLVLAGAMNPAWAKDFLFGNVGGFDTGAHALKDGFQRFSKMVKETSPVTLSHLRELRERWEGKLVVKGIQRGDEINQLIDIGVDGVVVSNHGGRKQDGVRATIDVLPEVVEAAGDRIEVFMDGGIRRGWDVFKALALGARAVLVGRPTMYGLAVAGEAGVDRVLEILRTELERTMALCGCPTVNDIDRSFVLLERQLMTGDPATQPASMSLSGRP